MILSEAATQSCTVEKVFLNISQNSQEDICVGVGTAAQVFSCELGELFEDTLFYRIPTKTVSVVF